MRTRVVLCALSAVGLLASSPVSASSCPLLVDGEGDGRHQGEKALLQLTPAPPVLVSPLLDLLSGDFASDPSTVVGVLRLKSTDLDADPLALLGMKWILTFRIGSSHYAFWTNRDTGGPAWTLNGTFGVSGPYTGPPPTVTVDATSITWSAPRSGFAELATPGSVFDEFVGTSYLFGGNADTMHAQPEDATYVDGDPGCI